MPPGEGGRRLQLLQAKLAASLSQMSAEADAIRRAELYWVSRDMVDVALDAADSLPEWYAGRGRARPLGGVVLGETGRGCPVGMR